jgi:transposase
MASIIETCKQSVFDPYAYLRTTLTAIANRHPASRINELKHLAFQEQPN